MHGVDVTDGVAWSESTLPCNLSEVLDRFPVFNIEISQSGSYMYVSGSTAVWIGPTIKQA